MLAVSDDVGEGEAATVGDAETDGVAFVSGGDRVGDALGETEGVCVDAACGESGGDNVGDALGETAGVCDEVSDSDGVALGGAPSDALVDGVTSGVGVVLGDCVGEFVALADAVAVPEFVGLCDGVVDVDGALVPDKDGVSLADAPMLSVVVDVGDCEGVAELVVVAGGVEEPESDGVGVCDAVARKVGVLIALGVFDALAPDAGDEAVCDGVADGVTRGVCVAAPLAEPVGVREAGTIALPLPVGVGDVVDAGDSAAAAVCAALNVALGLCVAVAAAVGVAAAASVPLGDALFVGVGVAVGESVGESVAVAEPDVVGVMLPGAAPALGVALAVSVALGLALAVSVALGVALGVTLALGSATKSITVFASVVTTSELSGMRARYSGPFTNAALLRRPAVKPSPPVKAAEPVVPPPMTVVTVPLRYTALMRLFEKSATNATERARHHAIPGGLMKRALVPNAVAAPTPAWEPVVAPPHSVRTWPSAVTVRTLWFPVSATSNIPSPPIASPFGKRNPAAVPRPSPDPTAVAVPLENEKLPPAKTVTTPADVATLTRLLFVSAK